MSDKAADLKSLRIDRSAPAEAGSGQGPSRAVLGGVAVVALAAGALAVWLVAGPSTDGASTPAKPAAADGRGAGAQGSGPGGTGASTIAPPQAGGLVASGYVVARRVATVSAEITARIKEVLVEEGMVVQAGQVLARLDSTLVDQDVPLARAQVASAQAELQATSANLQEAERVLARTKPLAERNAASQADLTSNEAKVQVLRAQREKGAAAVDIARFTLAKTEEVLARYEVHAPFTGVVTEKSAQPGEIVSPLSTGGFTRTGICTIVDMDSLEFEVDVNEANIGRVRPGQPVEAVLDAYPDWKIPAAVIAVIPTANRDKAAIKVRIGIKAKDPRILPNMAAKVLFKEQRADREANPGSGG